MYDINNYSYKDEPDIKYRGFNFYSLDENGLKKYLYSKQSYVNSFLPMKNRRILLKNIIIPNKSDLITDNENQKKKVSKSFSIHNNLNKSEIIKEETPKTKNKVIKIKNDSDLNKKYQENEIFKNKLYMNNINKINNNILKKSFSVKNMSINKMNKYNLNNNNNIPIIYKPNIYFQNFHRKMNFFDIFGYNQTFKRNKLSDICNISLSYLKNNIDNVSDYKNQVNSRKSSLSPNKTDKKEIKNINEIYITKLNNSVGIDDSNSDNEKENIIKKENKNLKSILLNQIDKNYLNKYHLPDIRKIADSHKIISKINNRNPKYFGEKYDPNAYMINLKTIRERNYVGAPFEYPMY